MYLNVIADMIFVNSFETNEETYTSYEHENNTRSMRQAAAEREKKRVEDEKAAAE